MTDGAAQSRVLADGLAMFFYNVELFAGDLIFIETLDKTYKTAMLLLHYDKVAKNLTYFSCGSCAPIGLAINHSFLQNVVIRKLNLRNVVICFTYDDDRIFVLRNSASSDVNMV